MDKASIWLVASQRGREVSRPVGTQARSKGNRCIRDDARRRKRTGSYLEGLTMCGGIRAESAWLACVPAEMAIAVAIALIVIIALIVVISLITALILLLLFAIAITVYCYYCYLSL